MIHPLKKEMLLTLGFSKDNNEIQVWLQKKYLLV